jgi:hypothetical protein
VAGVGVGGRAALEQLAGPALEHASRFDHPGFFAHMDPPTPWMTWAAALWAAVLTAGTVATRAVDPLSAARGAAWRHVDAAWAGPLRLSSHAAVLDGVQTADSVTVSAHRWLYQPKESALVLFRDPDAAHGAMSFGGGYLAAPNVGLLGSRGNAALALAALLLALGRRADRRRHGPRRAACRSGGRRAGARALAAARHRRSELAATGSHS